MENIVYDGVYLYPSTGTATATANENIIPDILEAAGASCDSIKEFELHTSQECGVVINDTHQVGTKIVAGNTDAVLIIDRPLLRPDTKPKNMRSDKGWGITSLKLSAAVDYYIVFYY